MRYSDLSMKIWNNRCKKVLMHLLIVQYMHIEILHSVHAPLFLFKPRNSLWSLFSNALIMTNFIYVAKENGVNAVTTEEAMALQNLFVLKKFRFASLCHSRYCWLNTSGIFLHDNVTLYSGCLWMLVSSDTLKMCYWASFMMTTGASFAQSI